MGIISRNSVEISPVVAGMDAVQDGGACSQAANEWAWVEFTLTEDTYLMAAHVCWCGWKPGDYGFATVSNLGVMKDVTVEAAAGQATVDIGSAGLANYYNPAIISKPVLIELWSASGGDRVNLIERRWVESVSGSVVTLTEDLTQTHAVGSLALPCYGLYTVPRGADNLEGGIFLCDSGNITLGNTAQLAQSALLTAGLSLCIRIKTNATVGDRGTAVLFMMRRPIV